MMNETTNIKNTEANEKTEDQTKANAPGVTQGLLIGLGILAMVGFWGTFAYAVWVENLELVMVFTYIIAIGAGVFGAIHFLSKLFKDIFR
jgi:hypothetical protein